MKLLHLQLFWFEKHHILLELEDLPELTNSQQAELKQWIKSRRKLLSFEVHQQVWVKVNSDGFSSELIINPNGTLIEKDLFSEKKLNGLWKVIDGLLFLKIVSGEFIVEYQVVGHNIDNIHSGIEYINGKVSAHSRFVQSRPTSL